jgi:6-pyruvoyltetrahydropterin/6-carboxytetrahydropterin synthase
VTFNIALEKENFKFSCSHFTIFGPNEAERLHGHNYYLSADFEVSGLEPQLGMAFEFNVMKSMIRSLTSKLDEYVLLPLQSPYVKINASQDGRSIEASFAQKRYVLPVEDVLCLNLSNITSEELTRHLALQLKASIEERIEADLESKTRSGFDLIRKLTIGIEETRGQAVFFSVGLEA